MRTSKIIAEITNTIDSILQVTTDYPDPNSDGKIPVLDLKIWVDYSHDITKIYYTFFGVGACPRSDTSITGVILIFHTLLFNFLYRTFSGVRACPRSDTSIRGVIPC